MGLTNSTILNLYRKKEIRILMSGVDGSGKTTIMYTLLGAKFSTFPTIGCTKESIEYKNRLFIISDGGTHYRTRIFCAEHFTDINGLMFVVDSSDRFRIEEAKSELHDILTLDHLRDTFVLIFANKQDLPNCMSSTELTDQLELYKLKNVRWHIQPVSATKGNNLHEGLEWFFNNIK